MKSFAYISIYRHISAYICNNHSYLRSRFLFTLQGLALHDVIDTVLCTEYAVFTHVEMVFIVAYPSGSVKACSVYLYCKIND